MASPSVRLQAVSYVLSQFNRKQNMEDQIFFMGTNIDILVSLSHYWLYCLLSLMIGFQICGRPIAQDAQISERTTRNLLAFHNETTKLVVLHAGSMPKYEDTSGILL